jgi:hypothetical protein
MQNMNMIRREGDIEESPSSASRSYPDLPKLPVDLSKLATYRIESVTFDIHEYCQYLGVI